MAAKFNLNGLPKFAGFFGLTQKSAWNTLLPENLERFANLKSPDNTWIFSTMLRYQKNTNKWDLGEVNVWLNKDGIIESENDEPAVRETWIKNNQSKGIEIREIHTWIKNGRKHRDNDKPASVIYNKDEEEEYEEWFINGERKRKPSKEDGAHFNAVVIDRCDIIDTLEFFDEDEDLIAELQYRCRWCARDLLQCDRGNYCPENPHEDSEEDD
jgi:hypothetical protein